MVYAAHFPGLTYNCKDASYDLTPLPGSIIQSGKIFACNKQVIPVGEHNGTLAITLKLRSNPNEATIITISSVSDRIPEPDVALYCSSKAANTSYFNSLAQEFKEARVFAVLPDYVETPMLHSTMDSDEKFDWNSTVKPEDIAQLSLELINNHDLIESGSNIIVVTEALKEDLKSVEKLHGFITNTSTLTRL